MMTHPEDGTPVPLAEWLRKLLLVLLLLLGAMLLTGAMSPQQVGELLGGLLAALLAGLAEAPLRRA
ncbi:hypothetical protein [Streptomyces sp. NPDC058412]|uniref:hypothetical protein n=1 Tax=Streptomyces sp. NPDC058412 TaxID=3346486 RepID=UPI0036505EE7